MYLQHNRKRLQYNCSVSAIIEAVAYITFWEEIMIKKEINRLLNYAVQQQLLLPRDIHYSANLLLDVFHVDEFEYHEIDEQLVLPDEILENMLRYAVEKGMMEDTITDKDLLDTRIMNCVMPRPSTVDDTFWKLYKESPKSATDYFYNFSITSNYIRKSRVDKDQKWIGQSAYGPLQLTINLSKPEKDPKEIAKLKTMISSSYPKCVICKENEGFAGDFKRAARQSIRLISLRLQKTEWFLQYSPYVYYQEHCIILNAEHKPMRIDETTFQNLISFLTIFPHYFIGSNADLPIVGGSILSHDHYQGGCFKFPMEDAKVLKSYTLLQFAKVQVQHVAWPLTTLRLRSKDTHELVACASHILETWKTYSDVTVAIQAFTKEERHNTITPIARVKDGYYELDLVLRNNRVTKQYPLGIFHPHEDVHHIKKENIGLIEVMGLAVLPARLKLELVDICNLLRNQEIDTEAKERIQKHQDWIVYLKQELLLEQPEDIMEFLQDEVSKKFVRVLEDCGVFKLDEQGNAALDKFMKNV